MPDPKEWARMASAMSHALGPVACEKVGPQEELSGQVPTYGQNLATLAMRWAEFEGMLSAILERSKPGSPFDDWETTNDIRHIARKARDEALQSPVQLPVVNADLGIYKPIYETFLELISTEAEVYNAVLRACDARASVDRVRSTSSTKEEENALFAVQYIQSLGNDALKSLPETEQTNKRPNCGCVLAVVGAALVLLIGIGLICGGGDDSKFPPEVVKACRDFQNEVRNASSHGFSDAQIAAALAMHMSLEDIESTASRCVIVLDAVGGQ